MKNRLKKHLVYGMDKQAVTIAQNKEKIMKKLISKKALSDRRALLAKKAASIGLKPNINRAKAATNPVGRRGCGCSRHG